jgi:hypothetical protein
LYDLFIWKIYFLELKLIKFPRIVYKKFVVERFLNYIYWMIVFNFLSYSYSLKVYKVYEFLEITFTVLDNKNAFFINRLYTNKFEIILLWFDLIWIVHWTFIDTFYVISYMQRSYLEYIFAQINYEHLMSINYKQILFQTPF